MIRLRGLPYDVQQEGIVEFFKEYKVYPESVIIGERSDGKRSGEGVILFFTEQQAERAVQELQGKNIGHRYIELFLHPFAHYNGF